MDAVSTSRLALVLPELAEKVEAMAAILASGGLSIRVVQGLRTYAEQDAISAQVPKVTNARGGYSMHNFGLAVDCVPSLAGVGDAFIPDWNGKDEHYAQMVQAGESQGLVSGSKWHTIIDYPHFQMPGLPLTPTSVMRADFAVGGLNLVWEKFRAGAYA